jgi:Holliday junction resolvase RusA-like endonuclease
MTMIELELTGQIVPKARPRFTRSGHAFTDPKYRTWKDGAIIELRSQYHDEPLPRTRSVTITLIGKHSRRGDADNTAGAILDALVQAGVLAGDNLNVVPRLAISLEYGAAGAMTGVAIEV